MPHSTVLAPALPGFHTGDLQPTASRGHLLRHQLLQLRHILEGEAGGKPWHTAEMVEWGGRRWSANCGPGKKAHALVLVPVLPAIWEVRGSETGTWGKAGGSVLPWCQGEVIHELGRYWLGLQPVPPPQTWWRGVLLGATQLKNIGK